jgi:hypothetical protein
MPTTAPSRLLALINRSFPGFDGNQGLDANSSAGIAGVLSMAEQLPERFLAHLTPAEQDDMACAFAQLKDGYQRWLSTSERDFRTSGGHRVGRSRALGDRHPLVVYRDLIAKCPDDPPGTAVAQLAFLADPALAADLGADISTALSAIGNVEHKAACVMAGSVVEALLLWAVKRKAADIPNAIATCVHNQEAAPRHPQDPDRWDLSELLRVARRLPVIDAETFDAADQAREYRNLIHPGRAERLQMKADHARAMLTAGAMLRVRDDLAARVAAGNL